MKVCEMTPEARVRKLEQDRAYQQANREMLRRKMRERHHRLKLDPEWRAMESARLQRYAEQNRDKVRIAKRKWKEKNPWHVWAWNHLRRVRLRGLGAKSCNYALKRTIKAKRCYYCGEKLGATFHLDHILPIVKGGTNTSDNLCASCPECNLRKASKTIDALDFIDQRLLPL